MDAAIRKYRYKLIYSGYAVIAFGAWSIARVFLMKTFDASGLQDYLGVADNLPETVNPAFAFLLAGLALDLLFRLYVGRSAVREGRGTKKKLTYVVLTILYTAVNLLADLGYLLGLLRGNESTALLAAVIVDVTASVAMLEIIVSSLALRRLGRTAA